MVCGLKVSHPRQRQSEITLSMQLSNEARDAVTLKNKRTLELWGSTFVFEKVMRRGGKILWLKWKEQFVFMRQLVESVSSDLGRLYIQYKVRAVF